GADVAALDDAVPELGELLLPLAHDPAHLRMPRDDRHHAVDPSLSDRRRHVGRVDEDAARLVELDRARGRQLAERRAVAEIEPALEGEPRERAVHRTRVEVAEAQSLCERAGDSALAGAGRPVDGDDHRFATESRRGKKPGKLIATLPASPISTP